MKRYIQPETTELLLFMENMIATSGDKQEEIPGEGGGGGPANDDDLARRRAGFGNPLWEDTQETTTP
jgi:hypothetical protein